MMASAWPFVAEVGRPQIYSGTTRLRALRQSGHARFAASTALALAGVTRPAFAFLYFPLLQLTRIPI